MKNGHLAARTAITVTLLLHCMSVVAQIRPSRSWSVEPLATHNERGLFPSTIGSIEIARGYSSINNDQAWQYRLHMMSEVYRFTDMSDDVQLTSSISFHHELTANPYNDISFNPRTVRWEEQVSIHAGYRGWLVSGGIVHRCKHDIDNLFGPHEESPTSPAPIQRTVIVTGPTAQITAPAYNTIAGTVGLSGGLEWYAFNVSDNRALASPLLGSWASMQGAAWLRASLLNGLSQSTYIRASYWASIPWFSSRYTGPGDKPFLHEAHAEVALGMKGASASLEMWFAAEHLFDDVSTVGSGPTSFGQLGIRLRPK